MKKYISLFLLLMMALATSIHANHPVNACPDSCESQTCYDPCDPCIPCAPACGTRCGVNWVRIGVATGVVVAVGVAIAVSRDSSHSHN